MTRVWLVILFGAATAVSCNSPDIVPPSQLNLDRPVDISFACYGPVNLAPPDAATPNFVPTAQPPRWCNEYSPVLNTTVPALPSGFTDPAKPPAYFWYGFILQPASGTVALSKFPAKPSQNFITGASVNSGDVQVVDADPGTPGKNAISVGENPIAIGTDVSGCHEIVANAGSCDLSVLDINSAVSFNAQLDDSQAGQSARPAIVNRLAVRNGAMSPVAIRAKAAAMVMQPSDPLVEVTTSCPVDDEALTAPAKGLAYIAYPGCNLVAGVDLATGVITHGIQFTGTMPKILSAMDLTTLTCVDECSGGKPADPASLRPVALDLKVDARGGTRRLAIGADNSAVVTVVDLDAAFLPAATAPLQVTLQDNTAKQTLGVTALALTPQIAMGNSRSGRRTNNTVDVALAPVTDPPLLGDVAVPKDAIGMSIGGEGQYVYAVATDGTVHVADVLNVKQECDTQVDMRFVRALAQDDANIPRLQCFPVNGAGTPPRRPGARGPGIELPVDGEPTSVAIIQGLDRPFTHVNQVLDDPTCVSTATAACPTHPETVENDPDPSALIGYFAVITATSGQTFVANVDDDDGPDKFDPAHPQVTAPVLIVAHQLRDGFGLRGAVPDPKANQCTASDPPSLATGGPRSSGHPVLTVAANTVGSSSKGFELPNLWKQACSFPGNTDAMLEAYDGTISSLQLGAAPEIRDEVYPDLRATVTQPWTMTWEGPLSNDTALTYVDGLQIRNGQMRIDGQGLHLIDNSRPFCDAGVEPFDIVQLRGCNPVNGDSECPAGYSCFAHENNLVSGLGACMLTSEAPRLATACKDFLTSARRYTVARAESGELTLLPRKHVLATTPIDGCTSSEQCQTLAGYAASLRATDSLFQLKPTTDPHKWECQLDPDRAPVNDDPAAKRCIESCATTGDCDAGTVCIGATVLPDKTTAHDGTCMESVLPSQSCINGSQRFDLHASEAFTLIGLRSGYVHAVTEKGGTGEDKHQCVKAADPGINLSRIPLHAQPCVEGADVATGAIPGGFEPNPCSTTVDQVDDAPHLAVNPVNPADACVVDAVTPTVPVVRTGVPAIKVRTRNATLTLVDPYSPGDNVCIGDRQGAVGLTTPAKIPQLLSAPFDANNWFGPSYQIAFDQKAGYLPLVLSPVLVVPALPIKVVRGPSQSVWIMDDGDVLAVSLGQSSTKGQVFRIEMPSLSTVNLLQ